MKRASHGKAAERKVFRDLGPLSAAAFGRSGGVSALSYLGEIPSLSEINDSNLVVALKNLLKKDETTKVRALEDLVRHAQAHSYETDGGVEDALLDVWTRLYPRISIENARRVRELAHHLQHELIKSAGKRMEKFIPRVVGAWLAGLYDRDRVVAKAANNGLGWLNTQEKVSKLWRKCQLQILDFAIKAGQETAETLSDERTTTVEDSEAKYYRVVAARLSLVLGLLRHLQDTDIDKSRARFDEYFVDGLIWQYITSENAHVRRTVCKLLCACLNRHLPYATDIKARQAFITGAFKTDQTGSAPELLKALLDLTQENPLIWISEPSQKKPPIRRLLSFIAKGSRGSSKSIWESIDPLMAALPRQTWDLDTSLACSRAMKDGLLRTVDFSSSSAAFWTCFAHASTRFIQALADQDQLTFAEKELFSVFRGHVFQDVQNRAKALNGLEAASGILRIHNYLIKRSPQLKLATEDQWRLLQVEVCEKVSRSVDDKAPGSFETLQAQIGEEGIRWSSLVGLLHNENPCMQDLSNGPTTDVSTRIINQYLDTLRESDLRAFGAVQALNSFLSACPHLFTSKVRQRLSDLLLLLPENMTLILRSSHDQVFFPALQNFGCLPDNEELYGRVWQSWTDAALAHAPPAQRASVLRHLVEQQRSASSARNLPQLQMFIRSHVHDASSVSADAIDENFWKLTAAAFAAQALDAETYRDIIDNIAFRIGQESFQMDAVLDVLEEFAKRQPEQFAAEKELRTALVAHLLRLSELGENENAATLGRIRSILNARAESSVSTIEFLQSSVRQASSTSIEISTLVAQAKSTIQNRTECDAFLPPSEIWEEALLSFLEQPVNLLTSITDPLGGSVICLNDIGSQKQHQNLTHMPRDARGRAACARLALYTGAFLDEIYEDIEPPAGILTDALYYLCLSAQLAVEQIACSDENKLWASLGDEGSLDEAERLVALVDRLLEKTLRDGILRDGATNLSAPFEVLEGLFKRMSRASGGLNACGVYNARALSKILDLSCASGRLDESLGLVESQLVSLGTQASCSPLLVSSLAAGMGRRLVSSKTIHTMINRTVSEIAGVTTRDQHLPLTLDIFTSLCKIYEGAMIPVAQNRIVFVVKQICSLFEDLADLALGLRFQICSALSRLLPEMKDLYGPYWEMALLFCLNLCKDAKQHDLLTMLPVIYSSLGLMETLENLQSSNEDIQDAFRDHILAKSVVLSDLLKLPREKSSQAVEVVDGMLFRETQRIPLAKLPEVTELYSLIASGSRNVQKAAFSMLHRKLPAQQQQLSVDTLLDDTDAQVPTALLSLLAEAPTLDDFSDEALSQFPATVRRYLLAWKLIFEAFSASSFKVRSDYTEQLKTGEYLTPLLTFMFDVLGHSIARPLNLDKESIGSSRICEYDITLADAGDSERSMHWLLAHLYYMTLKHLPGLFRSWFFSYRSKQLKSAVESWTVKFFSPLIIADTLDEVQAWADAQEAPAADEQELAIKTSKAAREVTAGYDVDESQAAIAITMPPSYPLESVSVTSLNRVAVSERKWQSWILTTQGVITFSNGSIIDGLQVFKRNITGALKGQSECAICYSIISSDRRMPDKRCVTCSNCFHRTCLYKWFQTSNQNTCPLCRNPIDYLGADSAKKRQA